MTSLSDIIRTMIEDEYNRNLSAGQDDEEAKYNAGEDVMSQIECIIQDWQIERAMD